MDSLVATVVEEWDAPVKREVSRPENGVAQKVEARAVVGGKVGQARGGHEAPVRPLVAMMAWAILLGGNPARGGIRLRA